MPRLVGSRQRFAVRPVHRAPRACHNPSRSAQRQHLGAVDTVIDDEDLRRVAPAGDRGFGNRIRRPDASSTIEPTLTRGKRTTNSLPFPGPSLLRGHRAAMSFDEVPYDREAEAQAALRSIDGLPLLHEEVKYARQDFRRDAHACIPDTDDDLAVVAARFGS